MAKKETKMQTTRKFFGSTVDIEDYKKPKEKIDNGTFVRYGWYDITRFEGNEYHKDLNNVGVRKRRDVDRGLETFETRVKNDNWKTMYNPPIIDVETDLPKDGRKRIRIALRNGETHIPAMYQSYNDNSERTNTTSGITLNLIHDIADEAEFDDITNGCAYLIDKGELIHTKDEVTQYLQNELNISRYFATRTINDMITAIMNLDKNGMQLMNTLGRDDAMKWLTKALGFNIDKYNETSKTEEYVLFTPGSVNSYRTLCKHIIPNSITGKITKIILYTTKELNPKIATDDMHLFKKILQDDLIANITTVVNNDIQGIKLETPFVSSYWEIEGCIPQKVNDEHQALFDNQQLIRLEDY